MPGLSTNHSVAADRQYMSFGRFKACKCAHASLNSDLASILEYSCKNSMLPLAPLLHVTVTYFKL